MGYSPWHDYWVQNYRGWDGPFPYFDPMVSAHYRTYDPNYYYPPDVAQALAFEEALEQEAAEQEAAKKTPPSTHSDE
jgi:hypothetical protein